MRTLYDHHRVPVAKVSIIVNDNDTEAVYVNFDNKKIHYSDCVIPLDKFNDWKNVRGLKEVVDMNNDDKQIDMFEV